MVAGATGYFLLRAMHFGTETKAALLAFADGLMPALIFVMLTITFLKVRVRDFRLRAWQGWGLLMQCSAWSLSVAALVFFPDIHEAVRYSVMAFGVCMMTPTATAAAVVTQKLGGNPGTLTLYTILIAFFASLFISLFVPLLNAETSFLPAFVRILSRIFPLLIAPFLFATLVRKVSPALQRILLSVPDMAFYMWTVTLALAICVTVRSIVLTKASWQVLAAMAAGSLMACVTQFAVGRVLGRRENDTISASQALGQKNTAVAIWVCATFMNPLYSVAGGFYSVWHNVWNSYQLRKRESLMSIEH